VLVNKSLTPVARDMVLKWDFPQQGRGRPQSPGTLKTTATRDRGLDRSRTSVSLGRHEERSALVTPRDFPPHDGGRLGGMNFFRFNRRRGNPGTRFSKVGPWSITAAGIRMFPECLFPLITFQLRQVPPNCLIKTNQA